MCSIPAVVIPEFASASIRDPERELTFVTLGPGYFAFAKFRDDKLAEPSAPLRVEAAEGRIALQHRLDALRVRLDLEAGAFELQEHGRPAVAALPAAVERFRQLGVGQVGEAHGDAQLAAELGGEPHVLVGELQGEARRVVLVDEETVLQT